MSSTKRLKHISMMLLWDDVEFVEKELCQSHGDLSHIFRNVFHNFVEQLKAAKSIDAKNAKKAKSVKSKSKSKLSKDKEKETDDYFPTTPKKVKKSKSSRSKKC